MLDASLLYYTCNTHDLRIEMAVRERLKLVCGQLPIGCVSRQPTSFGDWNIVIEGARSPLSMFKQILAGLERLETQYVFFAENDVLYHPSHFEFRPDRDDVYYYNINVWRVRFLDGHAVRTNFCQQASGLCANRNLLLNHYRERLRRITVEGGFDRNMGFEPGTHRLPRGVDNFPAASWNSEYPNIDIRHDRNLTLSKWSPLDYRNKRYAIGWTETDGDVPGWKGLQVIIGDIRERPIGKVEANVVSRDS